MHIATLDKTMQKSILDWARADLAAARSLVSGRSSDDGIAFITDQHFTSAPTAW